MLSDAYYMLVGLPPINERAAQGPPYLMLGPLIDPVLWVGLALLMVACIFFCAHRNYVRQQRAYSPRLDTASYAASIIDETEL